MRKGAAPSTEIPVAGTTTTIISGTIREVGATEEVTITTRGSDPEITPLNMEIRSTTRATDEIRIEVGPIVNN